jgi:hypothetical protein
MSISPKNIEMLKSYYQPNRVLPNGQFIGVAHMIFNERLVLFTNDDSAQIGPEDCWCYSTLTQAVAAMNDFDPTTMPEPIGWKKHPSSGRRGVIGPEEDI